MILSTATWLNRIETSWSLIGEAHEKAGCWSESARQRLLERYQGAAWRYLLAATRREDVAEDLFQEFALRLMRGDFRRAEPTRGRFRDYVKSVLINLVCDYRRRLLTGPRPLPSHFADPQRPCDPLELDADDAFLASWRDELLERTWDALQETHASLHLVLRIHVQHPTASAEEKGQLVADQLGETCSANRFRVMLHRAREKFSRLLANEVATSIGDPTTEELNEELRLLRLLPYCRA
jgi:RNA polymerase sigma-70 factor (ECF subfamily)